MAERTSRAGGQTKYESGRRCKHKGCETVLSIYNSLDYCALHTPTKKVSVSDHMRNGRGAR